MTPTDESGTFDDHFGNYSGEAKTEYLVLLSGLSALHNHKSPAQIDHEVKPSPLTNQFASLRSKDLLGLAVRNRRSCTVAKPLLPNGVLPADLKDVRQTPSSQPKLVKVSVYTKAVNPYIVIYDSNKKYAKPAAYLKLVNCSVKAGSEHDATIDDDNNNDDNNCTFRIFPNKHEDLESAKSISLQACSEEKRDEWVNFLTAVCNGKGVSGQSVTSYVPGSSVLPTLEEQEDGDEPTAESAQANKTVDQSLKSPSKRRNREGRRSSLNSLGIRLRCYSIGKNR